MKKFDNHVTKLQKEMVDITNNLNKFRNKNHKTISLIINNLNILSNEIVTNNLEYETKTTNKNSHKEKSNNSIEIYNKKEKDSSLIKKPETNKRSRMNSLLVKKKYDNYTFCERNNKNNMQYNIYNNMIHTPRRNNYRINNINNINSKFNDYYNDIFENDLKDEIECKTFNQVKNNESNKKFCKNKSSNIKVEKSKEYSNININNIKPNNINKYLKTEMVNKKKRNSITNLLFKNKTDFIYFNKNKQHYHNKVEERNKSSKIQNSYTQRFHTNKSLRQINTFRKKNIIKNIKNDFLNDNYKNISINKNKEYNKYLNMKKETSKNHEEDDKIDTNKLLYLLQINNINDIKERIKELNRAEIFTNKIISLFYKYNKNISDDIINLDDILNYITLSIKYKNENLEYELYCKNLMKRNNIHSFKEFKSFIDNILNKNIQNNNFIGGVKRILSTNIDDNSDLNFIDNINF